MFHLSLSKEQSDGQTDESGMTLSYAGSVRIQTKYKQFYRFGLIFRFAIYSQESKEGMLTRSAYPDSLW